MGDKLFSLLIVAIVGGAVAFIVFGDTAVQEEVGDIDGVQTYDNLSREHVDTTVAYEQNPPVGGDHSPIWLDCVGTVYDEPVVNGNAVHALEHGAVWVSYNNALPQEEVQSLSSKIGNLSYSFMSPNPSQTSPLTLTAWGLQLELESADDERIDQFLTKYRQGPQTPEPGASCSNPLGDTHAG